MICAVGLCMCQCKDVKREDVLYRLDQNNRLSPYHKSCGENLSDEQKAQVDLAQRRRWGVAR